MCLKSMFIDTYFQYNVPYKVEKIEKYRSLEAR